MSDRSWWTPSPTNSTNYTFVDGIAIKLTDLVYEYFKKVEKDNSCTMAANMYRVGGKYFSMGLESKSMQALDTYSVASNRRMNTQLV